MTLIGAFDPAGTLDGLAVQHVFCRADDFAWAIESLARTVGDGRTPLLTIEPFGGTPDGAAWRRWRGVLSGRGAVYVRYMHEPNGTWYPWAGDPGRFQLDWAAFAAAMPTNVRRVWCPNVSYPGSDPIIRYWPHPGSVDVIGIDGYARTGETPADLFRPTLDEIADFLRGERTPVWIAETGIKRSRRQARWWRTMMQWAVSEGIEAVIAFNEDKRGQGPDEADWRLTKAAHRALLGRR